MAVHQLRSRGKPSWIIVANESTANFYSRDEKNSPIHKISSLKNETAQMKMEDLISDRGGRSFDSHGHGRHTLSTQTDPKEHESMRFAERIVSQLVRALQKGTIASFTVVAAPRFLGMLRKALQNKSAPDSYLTISKDVVGHDESAIEELLSEQ